MFKFLKNKQNIASNLVFALVLTITFWGYIFLTSRSDQIEEMEIQLTELAEKQSTLVGSLREFNELLEIRLETDKELFIQLEQRIAAWQDVLKNADLSSTELTIVQAEIADVLQLLKRINETETVDLTESISEQSNSIETD